MKKRILTGIVCASMIGAALTGCGVGNDTTTTAAAKSTTAEGTTTTAAKSTTEAATTTKAAAGSDVDYSALKGKISLTGSTSMEKMMGAVEEAFAEVAPDVTVNCEFTGSGAGVEAVTNGTVDIGNASRGLKDTEKANGLTENIVAYDGIAVIVDPKNTVDDLTLDQVASIYKGEVTSWKELGGADEPIVVIGRENGSGTRGAFEELLKIEDACKYANELDNTGAVLAKVAATPGAIGYVSLDVVDDSVIAVKLEGVEATADNIKADTYKLYRPFVMATKGTIEEQNEVVQGFFSYIYSEDGAKEISNIGLIPVEK